MASSRQTSAGASSSSVRNVKASAIRAGNRPRQRRTTSQNSERSAAAAGSSQRLGDFRRRAEQLARRQTELEIMVTGPWPPYSFATEAQA